MIGYSYGRRCTFFVVLGRQQLQSLRPRLGVPQQGPSERRSNFFQALEIGIAIRHGLRQGIDKNGRATGGSIQDQLIVGPQQKFQIIARGGRRQARQRWLHGRYRHVQVLVRGGNDLHIVRIAPQDGLLQGFPSHGGVGCFRKVTPGRRIPRGILDGRRADPIFRGGNATQTAFGRHGQGIQGFPDARDERPGRIGIGRTALATGRSGKFFWRCFLGVNCLWLWLLCQNCSRQGRTEQGMAS